jgi:glutaredoxin
MKRFGTIYKHLPLSKHKVCTMFDLVEFLSDDDKPITIVSVPGCAGCINMKRLFEEKLKLSSRCRILKLNEIDDEAEYEHVVTQLERKSGTRRCPMIFFNDAYIGDDSKIEHLLAMGSLKDILENKLNILISSDLIDF